MTTDQLAAVAATLGEAATTLSHLSIQLPPGMLNRKETAAQIDSLRKQQAVVLRALQEQTLPAGWTQPTLTGA